MDKIALINRMTRGDKKSDYFHSSGQGKTQSGKNIGTAGANDYDVRQKFDLQRKYVRRYNNARIIGDMRAYDRAKSYTPRTAEKTEGSRSALNRISNERTNGTTGVQAATKRVGGSLAPSAGSAPTRRATGPRGL